MKYATLHDLLNCDHESRRLYDQLTPDVQTALDHAFEKLGSDATVLAMPYGGSTLPKIK